ncbi:MAG: META domain-containing protein [Caldilineaceae bacterium]
MTENQMGRKSYYPLASLLVALLMLTGCTITLSPLVTPEPTMGGTIPTDAPNPLANTSWQLTTFEDNGGSTPVVAGSMVTLEFTSDTQAGGNSGCNSYGGTYTVQGESITFSEMAATLMACTDADIMTQEQQYLDALHSADRFAVDGDQLTIWYDNDNSKLIFTAGTAPTPAPTTAESTAEPTTMPTEASTPLPTATPAEEGGLPTDAHRINFAPGASSAEFTSTLAERATDTYVLQAQQGQIMSVAITSPNNDVLLSVIGADGTPLKRYQNGPPTWTSTLPATQDYLIEAVSVGPATDYTLQVWVEPLGNNNGAEQVEFAPGETSASRSGALPEGGVKEYVLTASAGQTMHVQTVGYSAPVEFTIHGPGGGSWSGEAKGSEVYIYTAQVTLPSNGDYVVSLTVPANKGATRYDVTFTIDGSGSQPATPSPVEAEHIEFAPGTTSAERSGMLPSGPGTLQYVLAANEGQTMTVDATSDGTPLSMMIKDPTGFSTIPEMREVQGGYAIGAQFVLPATGDYVVTLQKADHTPSTNYSITFTIE